MVTRILDCETSKVIEALIKMRKKICEVTIKSQKAFNR